MIKKWMLVLSMVLVAGACAHKSTADKENESVKSQESLLMDAELAGAKLPPLYSVPKLKNLHNMKCDGTITSIHEVYSKRKTKIQMTCEAGELLKCSLQGRRDIPREINDYFPLFAQNILQLYFSTNRATAFENAKKTSTGWVVDAGKYGTFNIAEDLKTFTVEKEGEVPTILKGQVHKISEMKGHLFYTGLYQETPAIKGNVTIKYKEKSGIYYPEYISVGGSNAHETHAWKAHFRDCKLY